MKEAKKPPVPSEFPVVPLEFADAGGEEQDAGGDVLLVAGFEGLVDVAGDEDWELGGFLFKSRSAGSFPNTG